MTSHKLFLIFMLLGTGVILPGCTATGGQDHFSTEPGKGLGWKSMSQNNEIIQKGKSGPSLVPVPEPCIVATAGGLEGIERIPEQYLRIWIPAWQDSQGNLHEESSIQTIIRTGQWKIANPASDENRKA